MSEGLQNGISLNDNIAIYQSEDGKISLDVKLQSETIWLTQEMIIALFDSSKANISEHIRNIFDEGELDKHSTVRNFRTVRNEGNRKVSRNLTYYNLDMILSIGYRVKSKVATHFRKWATNILKDYLKKGYAINEKVLKTQKKQIDVLKTSISLLQRSFNNQVESVDEAQSVVNLLNNFAQGLDLLDDFDSGTLENKGRTRKKVKRVSTGEFLNIIEKMKSEFSSDVFANPKDDSFESSVNQIYQTFKKQDCYPTIEEKAAMLLYLITKNHSFSDGNKRIAASCFLYFLNKNELLYNGDVPIIDSLTLFALTVLIAESNPCEMGTMKQIVVTILNKNGEV